MVDAAVVNLERHLADETELRGADGKERFGDVEVGLERCIGD